MLPTQLTPESCRLPTKFPLHMTKVEHPHKVDIRMRFLGTYTERNCASIMEF